jgi:hypothetical protein
MSDGPFIIMNCLLLLILIKLIFKSFKVFFINVIETCTLPFITNDFEKEFIGSIKIIVLILLCVAILFIENALIC